MRPARSACHSISRVLLFTLLTAVGLPSASAHADSLRAENPDQHFRMGVAAFQRGDSEAAIREFELAYRLSPHYSVLYNLGLAYATTGRIVQGVNLLAQYLEEGGTDIHSERRRQVVDAIHYYENHIGKIEFVLIPQDAEVFVDGAKLAAAAATEPVRMAAGVHEFVVRAPGRIPETRTVTVLAGKHQVLRIELAQESTQAEIRGTFAAPKSAGVASDASSASSTVRPAQGVLSLSVVKPTCVAPDTDLRVDGVLIGRDHSKAMVLAAGHHRIAYLKQGYSPDNHDLVLEPGSFQEVACSLRAQRELPSARMARVLVRTRREHATITLDGVPYGGEPVPSGRHRLDVRCFECAAWSKALLLAPGKTHTMSVDPALLPEAHRQREEHLRVRRTYAWITAGTGLAFGIAASALYGVHVSQKRDWEQQQQAYTRLLADSSALTPTNVNAALRHEHAAMSVQQTADATIGAAAVSAVLMTVGVILYFADGGSSPKHSAIPGRQAVSTWPTTYVTW